MKIDLTEEEMHMIMNVLTVKSMSGNLDEDEKSLGKKINKALKELESKE
jgi:hypothetical protein